MHLVPTRTSPSGSGGRRLRRVLILFFAGLLTIGVLQPSTAHPGFKGHNGAAKLWVEDTSVVEPDTGTTLAKVKIVLKAKHFTKARPGKGHHAKKHRGKVKVFYTTVDGTAKAGEDYTAVSGRTVIPRKSGVTYVEIPIIGDTIAEPEEYFKLVVKAKGAKVKKSVAIVTIIDNDKAPPPPPVKPDLAVDDVKVKEGDVAHFKVYLSAPTTVDVEFSYTTTDGSAVAGKDYVKTAGTGSIPAGQTWTKVAVPTLQDDLVEKTETFYLDVTGADNATVVGARGTAAIYDDDEPKLWVKGDKVHEGDKAYFKVVLSQPSYKDVTFKYVTVDGTAEAGLDYEKTYGKATIPAGKRYVVLPVRTIDDKLTEPDETFYLKVFHVRGAKVVDNVGKALILDDDPVLPKLVVRDLTVDEGEVASFQIWLSAPAPKPVTLDYTTVDAKAKAGLDYKAESGSLVIPKGETGGTVLVKTKQDLLDEFDEDFLLRISNVEHAEVLKAQGRAVIIDDDPEPLMSIGKATAAEGSQAVLTVSLSAPSGKPVTVDWETVGGGSWGNAQPGVDFTAASGSLTFLPGETTKEIKVDVLEDKDPEAEEQFLVRLSNEKNATVAPGGRAGIVTIPANDT
jgi:large repetitive protein